MFFCYIKKIIMLALNIMFVKSMTSQSTKIFMDFIDKSF